MFDLDAYLARVGYAGPRVPTLPVSRELTAAHAQAIPFENLDVLLGRRIDLAIDAVFAKLVRQGRGGYCFEQNGLLLQALTALGYEARPLSARVRIDRHRARHPAYTEQEVALALCRVLYGDELVRRLGRNTR
jgi:N-hydroxyarylamine O-acetyltransferase